MKMMMKMKMKKKINKIRFKIKIVVQKGFLGLMIKTKNVKF